jgi:hypothetical protein
MTYLWNSRKNAFSLTKGFFSTLLPIYGPSIYGKDVENETSARENNV